MSTMILRTLFLILGIVIDFLVFASTVIMIANGGFKGAGWVILGTIIIGRVLLRAVEKGDEEIW